MADQLNGTGFSSGADIRKFMEENNGHDDLHLAGWPSLPNPIAHDPILEARAQKILAAMNLAQKVGQIIQADISAVTAQEVKDYHLGSVLNGGNSAPDAKLLASPQEWLNMVDGFWTAPLEPDEHGNGAVNVPAFYGTDAVHGHSNIAGATIFPHNVNLGAAGDAGLAQKIGAITALEMRATGMEWAFAPTIAVACDTRWGRAYESFGVDPQMAADLGAAMIEGLQGKLGSPEFLGPDKVAACAKHFMGDGGVRDGKDQGDTDANEIELRDIHSLPYQKALSVGLTSVMASFSSWGQRKVHARHDLLTRLLKHHWAFDGLLVGDWNAHGQLDGATPENSPSAANAGLDLYMAPDSWKGLYDNLMIQCADGTIPIQRLDDAVLRMIRIKLRLGLMDLPRPKLRKHAGDFALLANEAHRAIAKEAVQKSAVLLKNHDGALPIKSGQSILICGRAADDLGAACGGWTLSWQGGEKLAEAYPDAQTLKAGIEASAQKLGCAVQYDIGGYYNEKPDVAIIVIGEDPYAEFRGDMETLDYRPADKSDYELIKRLKNDGITTMTIFLSGRPLWVNPALNASDAFVAGFLPGTQCGAMADLFFANGPDFFAPEFSGRLSMPWPENADDVHLCRAGRTGAEYTAKPLFPIGFGLQKSTPNQLKPLHENGVASGFDPRRIFASGVPQGLWTASLIDEAGTVDGAPSHVTSLGGHIRLEPADYGQQENARKASFGGAGQWQFDHAPFELSRDANADIGLWLDGLALSDGTVNLGLSDGQKWVDAPLSIHAGQPILDGFQLRLYRNKGVDINQVRQVRIGADTPVTLLVRGLYIAAMVAGTGGG